jgi:hypothetical protein
MIDRHTVIRAIPYLIVAAGAGLSLLAAVIPHESASYKLAFGLFVATALPYVVYGMLTGVLRGMALLLPGVLLIGLGIPLTFYQRFFAEGNLQSPWHYAAPLLLGIIVLPLGVWVGSRLDGGAGAPEPQAETKADPSDPQKSA